MVKNTIVTLLCFYYGVMWYFYHSLPVPKHHGINTTVNYGLLPWFTMVFFHKGWGEAPAKNDLVCV